MKPKKPTNFLEVLIAERRARMARQSQNSEVKPVATPVRTKVKRLEAVITKHRKSPKSPEEGRSTTKWKRRSGGQGRQPSPLQTPKQVKISEFFK